MPRYEYNCAACEIEFDELLLHRDEIEQYKDAHPCPSCKEMASRNYVSSFGFAFKGQVRGRSGVHGNSGVHDLDYPTLDKAVARSSEVRWKQHGERQTQINEARKNSPSKMVSQDKNGNFIPTPEKVASVREAVIKKSKE